MHNMCLTVHADNMRVLKLCLKCVFLIKYFLLIYNFMNKLSNCDLLSENHNITKSKEMFGAALSSGGSFRSGL